MQRIARSAALATLAAALIALTAAGPAPADAAPPADGPLSWSLKPGLHMDYDVDSETVFEFQGQVIAVITKTELSLRVQAVDGDGARMRAHIQRMQFEMESPFGLFEYDSNDEADAPKAEDPVYYLYASVVGRKFDVRLDEAEGLECSGMDTILDELAQEMPQGEMPFGNNLARQARGLLGDDSWTNTLNTVMPPLAGARPAVGATWKDTTEQRLAGMGGITWQSDYRVAALDADACRIEIDGTGEPAGAEESPFGGSIEVVEGDIEGEAVFDRARGLWRESNIEQSLSLEFEGQGQVISVSVSRTLGCTLRGTGMGDVPADVPSHAPRRRRF